MLVLYKATLTDPTLNYPGSLLKSTPPPPGYPWVSESQDMTPKPRFRGFSSLVINHQLLKNHNQKSAQKDPILIRNRSFWVLAPPNLDDQAPNH